MVQKVDLDEREHALNILQQLDQMKRDRQHCDFIVSVEGNEIHTHRNMLSAGSDYFKAMLTHDTKESQLGRVEMIGVDPGCVTACINYIYTGQVEIPEGKIEHLICVSALMQLDKLSNSISLLIGKNLDTNTFYSTRRIAEMYDLQDLLSVCKTFERENIFPLFIQDEFQSEEDVHIAEILTSALLSEQEKLIVSLRWVGSYVERKSDLLNFLKSIRLEEVSKDYLIQVLENNNLIKNDFELHNIFNKALVPKLKANSRGKSLVLFDGFPNSLRQLSLTTNRVRKFHDAKFAKFEFSAIALHSYIYIVHENQSVHRLRFKDKKAKWEKMQDMIEDHGAYPSVVCLNGLLYVIAGDCNQTSSTVEKFFPGLNRWVKLKNKPIATAGAASATLDGSIYSIGGETNEGLVNTFHKFYAQSVEWSELEPMRQAKQSFGAVGVNQKIYVFGGLIGEEACSDMDCYDVTLKQWTRLSPMVKKHYFFNAHHVSGWIFAVERDDCTCTIEEYDIERDEWQRVEANIIGSFHLYESVLI